MNKIVDNTLFHYVLFKSMTSITVMVWNPNFYAMKFLGNYVKDLQETLKVATVTEIGRKL